MKIAKTEDEGWCYVGAAICAIALTVRLFTDAVVKPDDILTPHGWEFALFVGAIGLVGQGLNLRAKHTQWERERAELEELDE